MLRIGFAERRARLARRHRLAPSLRADNAPEAARAVVALHSTDPLTVYLSVLARTTDVSLEDVDRALYEDRSLVRMLGMRRTLFVVPRELTRVVDASCTRAIAVRERSKLLKFIAASDLTDDPEGWVEAASDATLTALTERGEALTRELSAEVPLLSSRIRIGAGTKFELTQSAASRILFQLSAEGRVVRTRPRGSRISGQYRWAPWATWLDDDGAPLDPEAARIELVRRWLAAFGPGTEADLRWWAGWPARDVRAALLRVPHVVVDLDGVPGLVLEDDVEPTPQAEPWAALLPALDPTTMGWKERDWYLGPHAVRLFDRNGNAGPTVWWQGRVVGGWTQRRDGQVAFRLLEEVGSEAIEAIEREAASLEEWLGDMRFTPRFPTPLQRELAS